MHDLNSAQEVAEPALQLALPKRLQAKLNEGSSLPSMPAAVGRVLSVARQPDAGLADFARAIENDPALTLRLLSLANSAFYSRHQMKLHTCYEAVSRIGLDATLAAVMSFGLSRTGHQSSHLALLWQRATVAALAARYLAQQLCPVQSGTLFTMALLQDIGVLALDSIAPQEAERLYANVVTDHSALEIEEATLFGSNHAVVGAWLAQRWGVPEHLVSGIEQSHGSLAQIPVDLLCLRLSGPIADAWLSPSPAKALVNLVYQFKLVDGAESISIHQLLNDIQNQLPAMASLLDVTAPPQHDNEQMLQEAQQHLFKQTLTLSARLDEQQNEMDALRKRQDDLEALSRQDALTGLANRPWLEEQLQQRFTLCQAQTRTMSIVFIDLDHFKDLNDEYGHQVGDRVLERFGTLLNATIREGDLAGRYGGEEFLVILPDENAAGARVMVERLLKRLAEEPVIHVQGKPLYVSASVGIASHAEGAFANIRELIDAADQCMYGVKRSGRSGVAIYGG
ncbi:sensor domain-containing diguanylate cyclase [Vreelandella massiliensis]|uniref:sensor domain-containing diguanylate cyclase n=1 Tax=Vreelandella massiliensis TaxID=1816686 RepID=UPI00096AA891|nr:GGDEF domain-containing protein [Halomonas massiliensis]MYL24354.1 diguanylate cyclase [Halomonas alkaliantarctica]